MALKHQAMLAVIAFTTLTSVSAWAQTNVLEPQQQGGIPFVTGGIGKDESAELQATQHNYNLNILNADKTGHYLDGTRIVISDLKHNALLDSMSGPLFYATLPKGHYIVEGFNAEQSKKQSITITSGKSTRVRFVWPDDMTVTAN
ncbi:MAG: hypothetical protein ACOYJ2_03655 [Rickettsiales bacterium]